MNFGNRRYSGELGTTLEQSQILPELILGVGYQRYTLQFTAEYHTLYDFDDDYVATTGYREESLNINSMAFTIEAGFLLLNSLKYQIEPLVGIRWNHIWENPYYYGDPHPFYDLNARSHADPTVGLRFRYRVGSSDEFTRIFWLVYEVRLSRMDWDNAEYGSGRSVENLLGLVLDWEVF